MKVIKQFLPSSSVSWPMKSMATELSYWSSTGSRCKVLFGLVVDDLLHWHSGHKVMYFVQGCIACLANNKHSWVNWGLYLPQVIPCGIHRIHQEFHMESMKWMLAETPANFLFHGHHGFHVGGWNGHKIHSTSIPWNKFKSLVILLESKRNNLTWLPKTVATLRIKHWAAWGIMWCIDRALLPLYYAGIERYETKLNKSCYSLATHKSSIGQPWCTICHHQQTNSTFIPTTTTAYTNHSCLCQPLPPHHHCCQHPLPSPAINDCSQPPQHTWMTTPATWQCHVTGWMVRQ